MTELARVAAALVDRYRVERELGAGGMATVYLAHDPKHARDVAIKVLHPDLAAALGAERFLSEIRVTARMQHPHVLPLLDSGEAEGLLFYVMPLVTGETLRARLAREGQLPIEDAVRIAREVADALHYAHSLGVVHRDVKPENVLLQNGHAVVADFGIALAVQQAGGQRMTQTGLSLGTPQYMSPEQALGERTVDARSDVYAVGAVTYEMLVGEAPFTGPSVQAIVARVLTEEPRGLAAQRRAVPPGVEDAVLRALEKLPADRFASAAAFAAALADPGATAARVRPPAPGRRSRTRMAGAAVAAMLLAGTAFVAGRTAAGGLGGDDGAAAGGVVRASLTLGDSLRARAINNVRLAIAPDGRRVVFVGNDGGEDRLWVRDLGDDRPRALEDTRGAFAPFLSPDGAMVGFFTSLSGTTVMRVVPIAGGSARTVVPDSVTDFGGADWGDDGQIYFTYNYRNLARVPADGGAITRITRIDSASAVKEHDYPDVLPGSRHAVVMLWRGSIAANRIGLVDLGTGEVTDLGPGSYARYVEPGRLVIGGAAGRVVVASLDVAGRRIVGTPEVLLPRIQWDGQNGTLQFAVTSRALAYLPEVGTSGALVWVDRAGRRTAADAGTEAVAATLSLSPDGRRAVYVRTIDGDNTVWVRDFLDGTSSRMSFDVTGAIRPVWTPDGQRIAYIGGDPRGRLLAWTRRADGTDSVRRAVPGDVPVDEIQFDPRGRYTLLRSEGSSVGSRRLLLSEAASGAPPRLLLGARHDHYGMALSPDGNWLAYVSTEAGWPEVYVRPFPNVDSARVMISAGGGTEPVWGRDGRELFYRDRRGAMYAVPVTTGPRFSRGSATLLFATPGLATDVFHRSYDVHPDGQRFLMVTSAAADAAEISLILDWQRLLTGAATR